MDALTLYRPPTPIPAGKNRLTEHLQTSDTLTAVKTESPDIYSISQKRLSEHLHKAWTLRGSQNRRAGPLQAAYALCGSQNRYSETLQAPYMLFGSQNRLSKHLQDSYMLCGSQNRLAEQLPETCTLCGIETDWPVFYRTPTPLT